MQLGLTVTALLAGCAVFAPTGSLQSAVQYVKEHEANASAYRKEGAGDILNFETMSRSLVLMPKNEVAQNNHE